MASHVIEIDLDKLTIGDLELIDRWRSTELPLTDRVKLLDRVVKGGVKHLPLKLYATALDKLGDAVASAMNQQVDGKN